MTRTPPRPEKRWARLEVLFQRALERPVEERRRFLDALSGDDARLRAELRSLLAAHESLEEGDEPTSAGSAGEGSGFLDRLDAVRAEALLARAGDEGPRVGDGLGPYRILRRLGQGGMGVVYLAEDPRLDRKVALKLLPPWLSADPAARRRLMVEAKAASALDHANVATIFEIDESEEGRLYIAMAYYAGESLADRIDRGPLAVMEAVGIARQVAEGLAAAHERGIVHRDVKAANVMLTPGGGVKILDFGIAKVGERALTRTGTTPGTAAYMSPEQTRGDEVDARSDLWSLGILLYEMLAGTRPFRAAGSDALVYQIRHDDFEPLERVRPDVPEDVARLVGRCLRKDPAERYASAGDLLDELERAVAAVASPSGRPRAAARPSGGPPGHAIRSGRRVPQGRSGMPRVVRAGMGAMVLAGAIATGYGAWSLVGGPRPEPSGGDERSIAVLPFENTSGAGDAQPYARGVHDDLLNRLSSISGFRVISRRAVERYRDSDLPTGTIARDLGVRWVLEGSVEQRANRIQVSVRLVDPRTESYLWTGSYERDLTARDLFALQGEITMEITRSLERRLTPAERDRIDRRPTEDLEAYRLYVVGRTHLDQRSESGLRQGTDLFRRAIALDAGYAAAWAGLADALVLLAYYGHVSRDAVLPEARDAAERALSLDPGLAEAHASRGLIHQTAGSDGPLALQELRRATELSPSYARAHHWLGSLLINLGRLGEAGASLTRAAELDPTSPPIRASLARWYQYADSLELALAHARRAEQLSPSYPAALMLTGEVLRGLGRLEEARDVMERALQLPGVNPAGYPGLWVELALTHRSLGDTARARQLVDRLEAETPPFVWAAVHAGVGQRDTALVLLSVGPVIPDLAGILRYQPVFDSLREETRFHDLLRVYDRAWGLDPDPGAGTRDGAPAPG